MEPAIAEVLILNGLAEIVVYKVVNKVDEKILGEFEGPRGGGA